MKYLNKRDEFLRHSLSKINEFKQLEDSDIKLITEDIESGPFANDIPWGDSLLGRLINSTIRKAKIGVNLNRIKTVERRLRDAFDDILDLSKVNSDEESKKQLSIIMDMSFLYNLEKSVKEKNELLKIKNLTNAAIKKVEENSDITDREELLRQLKAFKDFLDGLKDKTQAPKETTEYGTYLENLKSIFNIVQEYAKLKQSKSQESSELNMNSIEVGKEYVYTNKKGEKTIVKVVDKVHPRKAGVDKQWLTDDDVVEPQNIKQPGVYVVWKRGKVYPSNAPAQTVNPSTLSHIKNQPEASPVKPTPKATNSEGIRAQSESIINEADESMVDAGKVKILKPIKSLYDYINQDGETMKELGIFFRKETSDEKYRNLPKFKGPIERIYKRIKSKGGVNEGLDRLLSRAEELGDKIFELYQISKIKEDGNFEGIEDSMKKSIAEFNRTMGLILKPKTTPTETETPEAKTEKMIFKYSNFLKILEADDTLTQAQPQTQSETDSEEDNEILKWWNENMDIKKWLDEDQAKKIKEDLDKKLKEEQDSVTIYGMDPILEIVKCFNRAYKLHTTQVIPSGRSGGKVSNKTFMEYTCFGNGSPANAGSGGGPYRNNAIFNHWENVVLSIKGERKYQPIFNKSTILKVGNDTINEAGANLAKFMRDMLDGEELYRTEHNQPGAQAKFLEKYFGYTQTDPDKIARDTNYGGMDEQKYISNNSKGIKDINIQFSKEAIKFDTYADLKGSSFAISAIKDDGTKIMKYFLIQEIDDKNAYVSYSTGFGYIKDYMTGNVKIANLKGDLPTDKVEYSHLNNQSEEYQIKAVKIPSEKLINHKGQFILTNNKYEIKYLLKYAGKINDINTAAKLGDKLDVFKITGCFTLCDISKNVNLAGAKKRYILSNPKVKKGFPNLAGTDRINETYFKKI